MWEEAVEFCRKVSELPAQKAAGRVDRLPTEAGWEHAVALVRRRNPVMGMIIRNLAKTLGSKSVAATTFEEQDRQQPTPWNPPNDRQEDYRGEVGCIGASTSTLKPSTFTAPGSGSKSSSSSTVTAGVQEPMAAGREPLTFSGDEGC